jgi:hypothetical protein
MQLLLILTEYSPPCVDFERVLLYFEKFSMKARSICVRLICATALVVAAPLVRAQDGAQGALSQFRFSGPFQRTLVVADLDDDRKPDGAILLPGAWAGAHSNFRIQLHFTDRPNTELTFESSQQALTLSAWDIDNDGDIDLLVEETYSHKLVHVWINEGHGEFHEGRVEDFSAPSLAGREGLQPFSNQGDCQALCLPVERSFETGILTAPQFGRPPSEDWSQVWQPVSFADSRIRIPSSSRAPPLS